MTIPFDELKARLMATPRSRENTTLSPRSLRFPPSWSGLGCEPVFLWPNWPLEWAPASPPSPDWKEGKPCRARKRFCVSPRRPAASFAFASPPRDSGDKRSDSSLLLCGFPPVAEQSVPNSGYRGVAPLRYHPTPYSTDPVGVRLLTERRRYSASDLHLESSSAGAVPEHGD